MSYKQYEIISLTMRYWFIGLIIFISLRIFFETINTKKEQNYREQGPFGHIVFFEFLFICSAFALLAFKEPAGFHEKTGILGLIVAFGFIVQYNLLKIIFPDMDRLLIIIVDILAVLGFIMLYRFEPSWAISQMIFFALGNGVFVFFALFTHKIKIKKRGSILLMVLAVVLLLLPIIFGKEISGAKNWVSLGDILDNKIWGPLKDFSFQPSELVKILLVFVLADWFRTKKTFSDNLPAFSFIGIAILLLVFQRDLGGALLYFYVFIFTYYIATSDWIVCSLALGTAVLGSFASYHLFSHVRIRIEAWKNPWRDIENKGYQIAHSLIAISSGGLIGTGLGLGSPQVVPAAKTDFIFSSLCEEFGIIAGFCIIGLYAMIIVRGISISLKNHDPYKVLLAFASTVALSMQAFTIIGGVIKMVPLTGVTMPFVSYGGSSIIASLALIGVLEGVALSSTIYEDVEEEDYDESDS